MTPSRFLASVAVAVLALTAPALFAATPEASPVAGTAPADPFTQDLLRRLSSADAAERQAAQKQLAAITALLDRLDFVQQLADGTSDSELKSTLQQRLSQLKAKEEEKRLTSLPGLTLNVKSAALTQVFDAMNRALNTGTKLSLLPTGPEIGTFDLDVKDKPFWEIIALLQDRQPMELVGTGTNMLRFQPLSSPGMRRYAIDGPAMVWVNNMTYTRMVNYRADTTGQPQLTIGLAFAVDPRIRATSIKILTITSANDNENQPYRTNGSLSSSSSGAGVFNLPIPIIPPDRLGKSLNLSFDAAAVTTVGDPVATVDDIQKNIGKELTMGNRVVRLTSFNTTGTTGQVQLSVTSQTDNTPVTPETSATRITAVFTDSTGRTLNSTSLGLGSSGVSFAMQTATPPFKLELRSAGRPLDIHLHFDLKDLPLP